MMARFFVKSELKIGDEFDLPDDVTRHVQVLRIREGQNIVLFNGDGYGYLAKIITLARRQVTVEVFSSVKVCTEAELKISLLMSIIANDKMDLVVQKAVELGVSEIIPTISHNVQRIKSDKLESRLEHWNKVIIAASEQSGRARLCKIGMPILFDDAIHIVADRKYILSPHHLSDASDNITIVNSVALLIGPEGGFIEEEVNLAQQAGFQSLLLGRRILRAETAALAGISLLQHKFGDFGS